MLDIIRNLDRKSINLMATVFVGIHVPMVSLILYGIVSGFMGMGAIFLVVFCATLVSTAISLTLCYSFLQGDAPGLGDDLSETAA